MAIATLTTENDRLRAENKRLKQRLVDVMAYIGLADSVYITDECKSMVVQLCQGLCDGDSDEHPSPTPPREGEQP